MQDSRSAVGPPKPRADQLDRCADRSRPLRARNPRSDNLRLAPLAQSAERLHGKYPVRIAVLSCWNAVRSRPLCAQLDAVNSLAHRAGKNLRRLHPGAGPGPRERTGRGAARCTLARLTYPPDAGYVPGQAATVTRSSRRRGCCRRGLRPSWEIFPGETGYSARSPDSVDRGQCYCSRVASGLGYGRDSAAHLMRV
jgi:hypothetical protein